METKLTVRVPRHLLENAKQYARRHHTTLTELISLYLKRIPVESDVLEQAPTVRQLTGVLSQNVNVEDYHRHLDEKYGR